jgi:hypothetical protein
MDGHLFFYLCHSLLSTILLLFTASSFFLSLVSNIPSKVKMLHPKRILLAFLPLFLKQAVSQASGSGTTTRYWDCCKASCAWAVSDTLSYGFAVTTIAEGSESTWCCACYELAFTSGAVAGKLMIVQATNTGNDLSSNQFDLAVCLSPFPMLDPNE